MSVNKHLYFLSDIGKEKFVYQDNGSRCPFCNREELSDILDEDDSILLVKNKFPTLADTFQTVLIETNDCLADISTYDTAHMRKIITFGTSHWLKMEESGDFKSVLFYKNHGPLSGGSINHAHMQIVGLKNIDYRLNLKDDIFDGIEIYREGECFLNISTKPNACSTELNIITTPRNDNFMADNIQNIVKYIFNHFKCSSFNLFFYQWKKSIICKVVPRYVTSPFLIGYSIPQTSNRLSDIAQEVQKICYSFYKGSVARPFEQIPGTKSQ
jgi:hypothetical protein